MDNHRTRPIDLFVQRYTGGQLPFVERIGGVDLVGLNSATAADDSLDNTHGGHISHAQLAWLADVLPPLDCPVVVLHHNLTRRESQDMPATEDIYQLDNADEVATVLANCGVSLVLAGHTHWPAVGTLAGVREVVLPATCSFPQAHGLIHIGPEGADIELIPLADQSGLQEARNFTIDDNRDQLLASATGPYPLVDEYSHQRDGAQNRLTHSKSLLD